MVKIQPLISPANALNISANNKPDALNSLKALVGQTVPIQVTHTRANQVSFNLNGQTYQAQTQLDLKPNDRLNVNVHEHNGKIRLSLTTASTSNDAIKTLYRQLLPTQTPIQQTLSFLTQPQVMQQLPAGLQAQISLLIEHLLRPQPTLDGKRLQLALANSGMFFEKNLTQAETARLSQSDIKAQLFKLQHGLENLTRSQTTATLTQALTLISQSINKISLTQLEQLENQQQNLAIIPVNDNNRITAIQLEIRQKQIYKRLQWEVILSLSLKKDDDVLCKLSWIEEDFFNCLFYVEDDELSFTIQQQLPELKCLFDDAGLALNMLQLSVTKPQFSQNSKKLGLIDVKI